MADETGLAFWRSVDRELLERGQRFLSPEEFLTVRHCASVKGAVNIVYEIRRVQEDQMRSIMMEQKAEEVPPVKSARIRELEAALEEARKAHEQKDSLIRELEKQNANQAVQIRELRSKIKKILEDIAHLALTARE